MNIPAFTRDAQDLQKILRVILSPGGTVPRALAAYKNGMTSVSEFDIRKELYIQIMTVRALYEAIDGLMRAQTTVLNGGQATSLVRYWQVLAELNEYLTSQNTYLKARLSAEIPVSQHPKPRRANIALTEAGLGGRIPSKTNLRGPGEIGELLSFPSLSSSVSVPSVQSQPATTTTIATSSTELPPPDTTNPAPVGRGFTPLQTMIPSEVKIGPVPGLKPVPFEKFDVTGQLLQNLDHPYISDLTLTAMGRNALLVERVYGGKLIITNGRASFYESAANHVTIGLGPGFRLRALQAQKKFIHEQTHRYRKLVGFTPDPLKEKLKDYVERMLKEEAAAEGNGSDHVMELHPNGSFFTPSEWIYVKAYRQGYHDMKTLKLWATEEERRAFGRKSGQEALLAAFKDKDLLPSTISQDMTKSKEELYGYAEYYADKWQRAWDIQKRLPI